MRWVIGLLVGLAIGAGGTYVLTADRDLPAAGSTAAAAASAGSGAEFNLPADAAAEALSRGQQLDSLRMIVLSDFGAAERAVVAQIAARADMRRLIRLADDLLPLPRSGARDFAIEALLLRMTELDPRETIEFARFRGVAGARMAVIYARWMDTDAAAAIDSLRDIRNRHELETVAMALLEHLDGSTQTALGLLDQLPRLNDTAFVVEISAGEAEADPDRALNRALAMTDTSLQQQTINRIANVWAQQDFDGAMAAAQRIGDQNMRMLFQRGAMTALAENDSQALVAFIDGFSGTTRERDALMEAAGIALATADPRAAMLLADRMTGQTGSTMRQLAMSRLAAEDLPTARGMLDAMPPGENRRRALSQLAGQFARQDPQGALAWAETLNAAERNEIMANLMMGIAETVSERAIDYAINAISRPGNANSSISTLLMLTSMSRVNSTIDPAMLADRMLAVGDSANVQQFLGNVVSTWARAEPERAIDWLLANSGTVTANHYQSAAQALGQSDPELADTCANRIPAAARPQWIAGVAQGYAAQDPEAALRWLDQYRGQPGFEAGTAGVAQSMARFDPAGAAAVLSVTANSGTEVQNAATVIAGQWATSDAAAARNWTLTLPSGTARDRALTMVMGQDQSATTPDRRLLDAFSTDMARQTAVVNMATRVFRTQDCEAAALKLLDDYVTDPGIRRQAEMTFERLRESAGSNNIIISSPIFLQ